MGYWWCAAAVLTPWAGEYLCCTECAPATSPHRRYVPDARGQFAGQAGYGYVSIARFIQAAQDLNAGKRGLHELREEGQLALVDGCLAVTAILEAGRRSLDLRRPVEVLYDDASRPCALK